MKKERYITTTEPIKINAKIEATAKEEWELAIAIRRIGL
jgi:hypothetical protein